LTQARRQRGPRGVHILLDAQARELRRHRHAAGLGGALTIGAVLLALYLVGVVAVGGAVGSFMTTYWTLAFRRLDLDPVPFAPVQQAPPGAWPA